MSSQFKVKKVTKVKGPSDLSGKVSAPEMKKDFPSRGNRADRPQARGGPSSTKKNSSSRGTEVSHVSSKASAPSGPKPTARTKPAAQKQKTATSKACPAQESNKTGSTSGASSEPQGTKPVPRPRVLGASKSSAGKSEQSSRNKEKNCKTTVKGSRENASDSDSEKGSSGALNIDGDIGYGSGSFDDSDLSNNELLSPSAKEENKDFVPKPESQAYSYAASEFRPLIITDKGGVAAPVDTRHPEVLQGSNDEDIVEHESSIDSKGCVSRSKEEEASPGLNSGNHPNVNGVASRDARSPLLQYEEVEVVDGGYDRSNVKFAALSDEHGSANTVCETDNGPYSEVPDEDAPSRNDTLPKESTCPLYISDTLDPIQKVEQIYAAVHKSPKQENRSTPSEKPLTQEKTGSLPPAIPPRPASLEGDFNTCQSITGELQNMIQACENIEPRADLGRTLIEEQESPDCRPQRAVPPPIPKPYSGPGPFRVGKGTHQEKQMHLEDESSVSYVEDPDKHTASKDHDNQTTSHERNTELLTADGQVVYAAVDNKKSALSEELQQPKPVVPDGVTPPPLPKRPMFGKQMKKAHSTEDILHSGAEEKPKRSGLKLFKKKHRRQLSDGNLAHIAQSENKSKKLEASSLEEKPHHRRSKSQADITEHMAAAKAAVAQQQSYAEITIPEIDKTRSDSGEKPPVRAYMAVDIIEPPITPKEFAGQDKEDDGDLPEGWREVKADNGTYFWHVASGTTQWDRPQVAPRPKKKTPEDVKHADGTAEKQKVLSFPVHSMGWIELEENKVAPHNMSETISECISILATKRHDLWNTALTWGEGKDIRLLLEGDTLKLLDPKAKVTLLVQPVSKMRVWGVGKEDHRDFAYIARDPNTSRHKCHMFRCHGNVSGRAITGALHELCSKILEEKKRAQEVAKAKSTQQKPWSDILNTPPPQSVRENVSFNEKPLKESKRSFSAKYVGSIDAPRPTGIDVLQRAISKVASRGGNWSTVLIEITVSSIKVTDCVSQEVISDDRVRFMSFMGVGKDERLCGYIVHSAQEQFTCRVYQCLPNAATLTKAMEEACQLRYQKCIDAHPELVEKMSREQEQEKLKEKERERHREKEKGKEKEKDKDKSGFVTSMQGFLGKLGQKKGGGKKDDGSSVAGKMVTGGRVIVPSHTFMVKYYGALPVAVGTGIETVEEAAKHLAGGTLLVCQLDVALNGVTLYDSQRSALSRRHFDADTISYCGLTSNRTHFGLIQSMGGGKYICHVFAEYKTKAGPIVAAIHETM